MAFIQKIYKLFLILILFFMVFGFLVAFWIINDKRLKSRVLFTSPHTIITYRKMNQTRGKSNQTKLVKHGKEIKIDSILDQIQSEYKYPVFYNKSDISDPNWQVDSQFRLDTYKGQKYNFDLHGMSDKYGYDIALGTAGKNYDTKEMINFLEKQGLKVDLNNLFPAKERTITTYLSDKNVKAVQIEMSLSIRKNPEIYKILVKASEIFIKNNPTS